MSRSPSASEKTPPRLGLLSATCLVIASMVGASLFTNSGFALGDLGSREWVIAAWIVGSVVALCGAISYGALVRDLCESGGEYLFLSRRIHPLFGFLAGWISLTAGFTVAIAFAATTLGEYAVPLLGVAEADHDTWQRVIAVAAILLCTAQHFWNLRTGARLQDAIVIGKLAILSGLLVVGVVLLVGRGPLDNGEQPLVAAPPSQVFASSLTWIALAFSGFNAAVYVASDVERAETNVPRAMLLGTIVVAVLYVALNAVFVHAGPVDQLAGKKDIAAISMEMLGGQWLGFVCRGVVVVAMLTSVSANLMAGPRVYDRMAADGLFPLRAAVGGQIPRSAIAIQAALAILVVLLSDLYAQLNYLSVLLAISAAVTVASLFWSRTGQTDRLTPPVALAAGLFTTCSLVFAWFTLKHNSDNQGNVWIAVVVTLVLGVVFYLAMRWGRKAPRTI